MKTSIWAALGQSLQNADRWLNDTPERALDQAYDAALKIKALEDAHFDGKTISQKWEKYRGNTYAYFQSELNKYLKVAEVRLTEFKASRLIVDSANSAKSGLLRKRFGSNGFNDKPAMILEKLEFIDQVLERYQGGRSQSLSLVTVTPADATKSVIPAKSAVNAQKSNPTETAEEDTDGILDKTGVLPRSIVGTLSRIKRDLDPNSEQEVVQTFRTTKAKTLVSIRFLLLLIILPMLAQQMSKAFVVGPIVDHFRNPESSEIFINFELEEEALRELRTFEERLRFDKLLGRAPELSEDKINDRLKQKVQELAEGYDKQSAGAVKNVFSDLISLIVFAIVIVTNRPEIAVLKSFIDDTIYGLSDSAKAFIIILFTDIFVGFHSPHGWEVLLEGVSKHIGLPANRDFIFLFIATFPVILDTIFKYWIFRYLNRISPSAVATYRNMNE